MLNSRLMDSCRRWHYVHTPSARSALALEIQIQYDLCLLLVDPQAQKKKYYAVPVNASFVAKNRVVCNNNGN